MLSKFSVKKPYTVVVAVVLVIILGVVSFNNMTVDLLPSMNLPYALIMTTYPGASPEEVEATVTKPIEQTMATVSNINNISSTSQENVSTVVLEFAQTANMDSVTIEMRENLDQISGFWPETVGNPLIMKLNPDMMPVMVAAVSAAGKNTVDAGRVIEEIIIPELESIEGVASVTATGTVEETVEVNVNPKKIDSFNEEVRAGLDRKFAEADQALKEIKAKVESGKEALKKGQLEASGKMGEAEEELSKKNAEITQGQLEISEKLSALNLSELQLKEKLAEVQTTQAALQAAKDALLQLKEMEDTIRQAYQEILDKITGGEQSEELLAKKAELEQQVEKLDHFEKLIAELDSQLAKVSEGKKQLEAGISQIADGRSALNRLKEQLASGAVSLAEARGQMSRAQIETAIQLGSANAELVLGEQTLQSKTAELETAKEAAYQKADVNQMLTVDMVKTLLSAQNFHMPAGYVKENGIDYLIRVGEKFKDIEELKELVLVKMEGMEPIRLEDVADVALVDDSDEIYAKINGESGVMLSIQKQTGYSTGDVSDRILERFDDLKKEQRELQIVTLMDQGVYIDLIINSVLENLLYGAVLAIIILLVFLKSIRPTFVIACSIPISLMTAIVLMYFSGVTLNVISLSGLALGVGMLVDNSIVVIENIYRMRNEEGVNAKTAAIEGAKQVAGAIAASTLTTVCVFAPIVFTKGLTRQLFVDMGLTIAYSLLASLVVALTLVPMMAAGVLRKTKTKESRFFVKLQNIYEKLLRKALKGKILVLLGALALLIISGVLAGSKGTAFMPEMESTQIMMNLETEEGTPLQETAKVADGVMETLMKIPDIEDVGAMASSGSLAGTSVTNQIQIYAILKEDKELSNVQLQKRIEQDTKGIDGNLEINMSNMDMSALGSSGIVVEIKGRDLDRLQKTAKEVAKIVSGVKGTENVSDGMEETTEELRVVVDKEKAAEHNLTVAQVYQAIAERLKKPASATTLSTDVKDYGVFVLDQANVELNRNDIREMSITAAKPDGTQSQVPLKEIAVFTESEGLQSIQRKAQTRYLNVTAQIKEGDNIGLVSSRVKEALKTYDVPSGCEIAMAGEDETIMESMIELLKMLGLAIVFMYLIMVAQFQSLRSPFIIMFTIPLAFTGGLFGLFLSDSPVSVIAMIGFVMLSGIIVNNGIVFVDYTNQLVNAGMDKYEALVETGRTRLRPILMTAITTILGLSTMTMGIGTGADMVQPMAIVTVGGLIYGTILTLFVVPCIYAMFHRKEKARLTEEIERTVSE